METTKCTKDEENRVFKKLLNLIFKHYNDGISIIFEFGKFGIILRGYIDPVNYFCDINKTGLIFNKNMRINYSDLFESNINIEDVVDNFKEELLEEYKREIEKLEDT